MNNFSKRISFGLIFILILVSAITINQYIFYILFLILSSYGIFEFHKITKSKNLDVPVSIPIISSVFLFTSCFIHALTDNTLLLILSPILFLIIPIIELYRNKAEPIKNIAICFFQILYIGLPFSLCNYLIFPFGNETFSSHILLSVFLLVWTNDSGAYAVGVKFGRRRLFERISPKKSWEGSIGGAFFTFLGAYVISIFFKELSLIEWMGFAAIITVFAGYGDLVESMIKRSLKIKDSGNIIPGHGGFLDRFDAVLFAIPSIFIYMEILKRLA